MRKIFVRETWLGVFPVGLHSIIKTTLALALIATFSAANAVSVILITHNQTSSSGTISTLITDGSQANGGVSPSTAVWEWDGTRLTSTGLFTTTSSIGSSPFSAAVLSDQIVDLSINTATGKANATAYTCIEGNFLAGVGSNGCGGYTLGVNATDESTTVWGPGLAVSQTIGGDDVSTGPPRTISAYDFDTVSVSGTGLVLDNEIMIGNGIPLGGNGLPGNPPPGGELLIFRVVTSAVDDTASARPTETITIPVLDNDALLDSITALTVDTTGTVGTATVTGVPGLKTGVSIEYTATSVLGDDTFNYTVTDASGPAVTAAVTVTVTDGPVAKDDLDYSVLIGGQISPDVLANDVGLDDTPLAVSIISQGTLGVAAVTGSGDASAIRVDYTAGPTAGVDSFVYQITDNSLKTASATAYIAVNLPNIPLVVDDVDTTFAVEPVFVNVLANDTGIEDTPLTITVTSDPSNGVIGSIRDCTEKNANCAVSYVADAGFIGTDSFQYMVTDDTPDNSGTATVTITVNELPNAVEDAATALDQAVTIDVLANDTGLALLPSQDGVSVSILPAHGTAVVQTDNTIVYTPNGGSQSTDGFDYTVTVVDANDKSSSSTAHVAITIILNQGALPGKSSAVGPVGLGLLLLLPLLKRRRRAS